jgi:hypothetical protein
VHNKREEASCCWSQGSQLTNAHLLHGILEEFAKFVLQLLPSARINRSLIVVTNTLIKFMCEGAKHLKNRRVPSQNQKKGKDGEDEALAATGSETG